MPVPSHWGRSRALGNVSRAGLEFFVQKISLELSYRHQTLTECETFFSEDFRTIKNGFFKIFVPPTFILGDQFYFEPSGSPDFMTFGCESTTMVLFGDLVSVTRIHPQDITKNHENFMQNLEIFILLYKS